MPAIYAHRAFGEDLKAILPRGRFQEIFEHADCFSVGLHGPDTLFYFHPLKKNAVSRHGEALHEARAADFFEGARAIFLQRGGRAADRAYLYGFVCHFALDSVCHPEVALQMQRYRLSHTAVEAAFERAMMLRDGRDPLKTDVAAHLHATAEAVSAVAAYCGVTERQARTAIRSMVRSSRLLRAPDAFRRGLLHACLRIAGSRSVIDMIVPERDRPECAEGNAALAACYGRALQKAEELLENYRSFLAGEGRPDERFSSNYESEERI